MTDNVTVEKKYLKYNAKFFKFWAPVYDGIEYVVGGFRNKLVDLAQLEGDEQVADFATGTGSIAVALAKRGVYVLGIDISEDMLRVARKKQRKYPNFQIKHSDARETGLDDNSFDVSTISFALHDMPEFVQTGVLKEMARVTRMDGKVIIADYDLPRKQPGKRLGYWFVKTYETKFYPPFIKSDFEKRIAESHLEIVSKHKIINGLGRILICKPSA